MNKDGRIIIHEMKIPDHKHDNNGVGVLCMDESPYRVEDTEENRIKYQDKTNGASVTCSICGLPACDDMISIWGN